jgi:hypothetical protein
MLARVFHCSHANVSKQFDEKDCRVTRGLLSRDWAEFMVIWRKNRLELYEDYVREGLMPQMYLTVLIEPTLSREDTWA